MLRLLSVDSDVILPVPRGGFHPVTRLAMIAAFIIEWASATTDSRREQFKKLAGVSRLALIFFGPSAEAGCVCWQLGT